MKKIILFLLISIALLSCTSNFEKYNIDNARRGKGEAVSDAFLQPLLYYANNYLVRRSFELNGEIMQYTVTSTTVNIYHRYDIKESESDLLWRNLYRWAGNAREMTKIARDEGRNDIIGMGLIMEVLMISNLTDIFGEIPYKESFKTDEDLLKPVFDSQKEVYDSLFIKLEEANEILTNAKSVTNKDLLYNGDCSKWRKFCNSLHLRLLMRLSNRDSEVNVVSKIKEMVEDPVKYPIFTSVDDGARIGFTGIHPNLNYVNHLTVANFERSRRASAFFIEQLNNTFDPRVSKMFKKASSSEFFNGAPSGELESTVQQHLSAAATINGFLKENANKFGIMNYSELQFILAEACIRGYLPDSKKQTYYYNGIKASLQEWRCTVSDFEAFKTKAGVVFPSEGSPAIQLERVLMQKYVSLFFVGLEAWNDYKRTGYPVLPKGSAISNDGILPTRLIYPASEQATNRANWNKVIESQGEDNFQTKIWWSK